MKELGLIIKLCFASIGGFLASLLGGYDQLLIAIVTLVIIDYLTGVLKAIYNKSLSSGVGFRGIIKKVMIFIVIALAVVVDGVIEHKIPVREMTIFFFIANEGISILENTGAVIEVPGWLKNILEKLKEVNVDESED